MAPDYEIGESPPSPPRDRRPVDPITMRVIGGALEAIAKEMANVLFRMSHSSIIRESEDLGAGIFDADGREIAESDTTPMHIGSLPWYIRGFLRRLHGQLEEGDVVVHNHPYFGASHTPDVGVAIPVFTHGRLVCFVAVTAHLLDVGGSYPGINVDAYDVFAEAKLYNGLRWYRGGVLNEDLDRMIFDNVRTEQMNRGDMDAMRAACELGRRRVLRLIARYGVDTVMNVAYGWMDYSERMIRAEIAKIPDGTYRAPRTWLDDDGRNRDVRLPVEVSVIVEGDQITIDLTGSADEVATGFNVPFEGSVLVTAYFAIRTLLLDQATFPVNVPQNDGIFRPIRVRAPRGSMFNPRFPRACFSRITQVQRVADSITLAMRPVLPEKTTGGNSASTHFCSYAGFSAETSEYWVYLEVNEGCYGGRHGRDGMDCVDSMMANTRNNPIEEIELRFPLRTERYELRPEPAAPGRWRGGMSVIRENRFLVDGVFSCEGERHTDIPQGSFAGWPGLSSRLTKNPGLPEEEALPSKVTGVSFRAGDLVRLEEPFAGGYGDPLTREPDLVLADVLDGFTTPQLARDAYGVVVSEPIGKGPLDLMVDWTETEKLRARLRADEGPRGSEVKVDTH